ncbi:UNVERIFIED_CONTAM: hypothetical protein RMT77_005449 [Armadillidium vulgare]|nr:Peptidyl-tRNA hydrolase 2, mitochondrial [Armadillidium vulgare]
MDLFEQCSIYAGVFLLGIFAGHKMRMPLSTLLNLTLKERSKLVLIVRKDLEMGKGKVISQCCHGTLANYVRGLKETPKLIKQWESIGQPKVVLKANNLQELIQIQKDAASKGILAILIRDAGKTQISPGTETVLAVGPDSISKIDEVTGHLKLL